MKCAACQRDIADGSAFCPFCGNVQPVSQVASQPAPPAAPVLTGTVLPPIGSAQPLASSRGGVALAMGIAGILADLSGCCCGLPVLVGIGLGVAAFIVGGQELDDIRGGLVSSASEGTAKAARWVGVGSVVLGVLIGIGFIALVVIGALSPDTLNSP